MTFSWTGNLDFGFIARRPESLPQYLEAFNDVAGSDPSEAVRPLMVRLGESRLLPMTQDEVINMSPREMMDLLFTVRRWGDAFGVFEHQPDSHLPSLSAAGLWALRNPDDLKKFYLMQLAKFQIPNGIGSDLSQIQGATNAGVLLKPFLFLLDLVKTFELVDRYEKYISGPELESWVFPCFNQSQVGSAASTIIAARRAGKEPPNAMGPLLESFREFLTVASYTELLEVRRSWLVHEGSGFRVREGFFVTSLSGRAEDSHRARMIDYLLKQYGPRYFIFNPRRSFEDQIIEWADYYTSFDFGFEQRYSSRRKVQLISLESPDALEPPFYLAPVDLSRKIRLDGFVKFVMEDRDPADFPEKLRWIYRVVELGTHPENGRSKVRLERYRRLAEAGEAY